MGAVYRLLSDLQLLRLHQRLSESSVIRIFEVSCELWVNKLEYIARSFDNKIPVYNSTTEPFVSYIMLC